MMTPATVPTSHKLRVNGLMRRGLEALDPSRPIAFFCECGSAGCSQTVWLTRQEYDERKASPGWAALAPGHRRTEQRGWAAA